MMTRMGLSGQVPVDWARRVPGAGSVAASMAAPSIPLTGVRKIAVKVRRRMAESPSVLFQPRDGESRFDRPLPLRARRNPLIVC